LVDLIKISKVGEYGSRFLIQHNKRQKKLKNHKTIIMKTFFKILFFPFVIIFKILMFLEKSKAGSSLAELNKALGVKI